MTVQPLSKKNTFQGFVLGIGVGLLPVYSFGSGGIQPAHMFLALFSLVGLLRRGVPLESWVLFLTGISFYSFFVESLYIVLGAEATSLMSSVFFFYNLFLAVSIYTYCLRYGVSHIAPGLLVACLISIVVIGVSGISFVESGQVRATGTFNNPNQLGYFSVCTLSLTYLLYRHGHLKYVTTLGMFGVAILLSIASLSKAAMIANFVVALLVLKPVKREGAEQNFLVGIGLSLFWVFLALFVLTFTVVLYQQGTFSDYLFVNRLQNMMLEGDSSLSSRGYFVFLEGNAFQVLFGLGSKGVQDIFGHEVHSTLASVLNNYGIAGFLLFSGVLVLWIVQLWRAYGFIGMYCLTGPAILYGITHNGTRFTAFWILFAASMAMATSITQKRKSDSSVVTLSHVNSNNSLNRPGFAGDL